MMRTTALGLIVVLLGACSGGSGRSGSMVAPTDPTTASTTATAPSTSGTVRLLFAGDVMLGRNVEPIALAEGPELFEGIRHVVSSADLAAANLESPLTDLPHLSDNPNALEADPSLAPLLAGAGFDLMAVANNHAGDAGPEGLIDTLTALGGTGITPLGSGNTLAEAERPAIVESEGVRIALLAFDVTSMGPLPGPGRPGVAHYATDRARRLVTEAFEFADVVAVSLHGGVEYLPENDPILERAADDLTEWGVDVVWGHGAHVPQPVTIKRADRDTVIATSLGNLLFDQQPAVTHTGLLLEVLVSVDGVEAYRVGRTDHSDLRPRFLGWELPEGDTVLLDGEWWSLPRQPNPKPLADVAIDGFPWGDVIAVGAGDPNGDGADDLVVSYRHPYRETPVNQLFLQHDFIDSYGRSAHLGVFDPDSLDPVWGSGTMLAPVASLAVCDGGVALAFDRLDDPTIVGSGAWTWWDFGFAAADPLPGPGVPACADVDRDGATDPVIIER